MLKIIKNEKSCSSCRLVKPLSDFPARAGRRIGHSHCTSCRVVYNQDYRNRNRHKSKIWARDKDLKKFGITRERYNEMLAAQSGGCAICGGTNKNGRDLSIDHCHAGGHVRELLCGACNSGLGFFRDNELLLTTAIDYLRRHRKKAA